MRPAIWKHEMMFCLHTCLVGYRRVSRNLSDVDIAVYLSENAKCSKAKSEIVDKLADILLTDEIDVIILNRSSLPLSMNVVKHNRLLVDKKPFLRHAYQSLIMRKYFDYHHLESNILKRRFYPKDAKSGGHQIQGVKGEAVIGYRDSLTTQDMKPSRFRGR